MGATNPGGLGRIVVYTVVVTTLFMAAFVLLLAFIPSISTEELSSPSTKSLRLVLVMTTAVMLAAGVTGPVCTIFVG